MYQICRGMSMVNILKYFVCVLCLFITTVSYSASRCSTVFSEQPFTGIHNSTYDAEDYIAVIDRKVPQIFSRSLATKSLRWIVDLNSQVDSAKVLINLLQYKQTESESLDILGSDLSLDESMYIITSLILPKFDDFKIADSKKEKEKFHELLADVFGLKDIRILVENIQESSQKITDLLHLWTSNGVRKTYEEMEALIKLIRDGKGARITGDSKDPVSSLISAARKEILTLSKGISSKLEEAPEFENLNKIISFNQYQAIKTIIQKSQLQSPDPYCWYIYFNTLKGKTLLTVSSLIRAYIVLQSVVQDMDISSKFFADRKSVFLKEISKIVERLNKFHSLVSAFRIENIDIITTSVPFLVSERFIRSISSFLTLSNYEIYSGLSNKMSFFPIREYVLDNPEQLAHPASNILESFYNDIFTTYKSSLIDRSSNSHIYNYFTDFSHLQFEEYRTYLSEKYSPDFLEILTSSVIEENNYSE